MQPLMKCLILSLILVLAGCNYPGGNLEIRQETTTTPPPPSTPKGTGMPSGWVSPDGKWSAEWTSEGKCTHDASSLDATNHEELILTDMATGEVQIFAEQTYQCSGLGTFGFMSMFWSQNSRYFYFTDAREGRPDGGCGYWERPITRLDTTSMQVTPLYNSIVAPTHDQIASIQKGELVIYDIEEGETARYPLPLGEFLLYKVQWLPDAQGLLYIVADSVCPPATKYEVVHIDLETETQTSLLK